MKGFLALRGARVAAAIGVTFLFAAPPRRPRIVCRARRSFSSGVGTGSYSLSSACKRSVYAYPYLLSEQRAGTSLSFVACSGATTADVLSSQILALDAAPASIVTLTIGGNDIGFANLIYQCTIADCSAALDSTRLSLESTLASRLDSVYAAVQGHAAPGAKIVVLGYPHEFGKLQLPR